MKPVSILKYLKLHRYSESIRELWRASAAIKSLLQVEMSAFCAAARRPAAPNYDIKIIILFPFLFIIRIIILCGVIIGEMFRSDKRWPGTTRKPPSMPRFGVQSV